MLVEVWTAEMAVSYWVQLLVTSPLSLLQKIEGSTEGSTEQQALIGMYVFYWLFWKPFIHKLSVAPLLISTHVHVANNMYM